MGVASGFGDKISLTFNTINCQNGKAKPTKLGVHAFHIHPWLYEFFELILID